MHMHDIVSSLVDNIDKNGINGSNRVLDLDIIMSGGAFNANYLVGCLYFYMKCKAEIKFAYTECHHVAQVL